MIEKADDFKRWVKELDDDKDLVSEYLKSVTSKGWLDSVPVKSARLLINLGAGLLNPALGAGSAVIDSVLVDRIFRGWKPDIFINGPLRTFLDQKAS